MSYDPIEFLFQVHNDAKVVETAYLCPEGLPWGSRLDITPTQANIPPGEAVNFTCRLTLNPSIIRPGCTNDQGFRLTAWRVADDADERWGSCFYFLRPRIRTKVSIIRATWYEERLSLYGQLSLDTDQQVQLADQLPLRVRIRTEHGKGSSTVRQWEVVSVQPGGVFTRQRSNFSGVAGEELRLQVWFDRTDLLASSRSDEFVCIHNIAPVIK